MRSFVRIPLLTVLIAFSPGWADKLMLKNGRVLRGTITGVSERYYTIRASCGSVRVAKKKLKRVLYDARSRRVRPCRKHGKRPSRVAVKRSAKKNVAGESRSVAEQPARKEHADPKTGRADDRPSSAKPLVAPAASSKAGALAAADFLTRIPRLIPRGREGAFWRSAALPGWGQFHDGREVYGFGIAGAFVGLFAYHVSEGRRLRILERSFADPLPIYALNEFAGSSRLPSFLYLRGLREAANRRAASMGNAARMLAALYTWNLYDIIDSSPASVRKNREGYSNSYRLAISPSLTSRGGGVSVEVYFKF